MRNRRISTKNTTSRKLGKNPKSSTFYHEFERGITMKEPRRAQAYIPIQNRKGKVSKRAPKGLQKSPKRAPKITKKEKQDRQQKALRNHAKPSIHTTKDSYKT
jgi:hypothetical protein